MRNLCKVGKNMTNGIDQQTHKIQKPSGAGHVSAHGPGGFGAIELKGVTYSYVKMLNVCSGEADVFLVKNSSDSKNYIFKYYRHNIEPKLEIVEKLMALNSERVVRLIDYGVSGEGRFYEVQEFAEHGSLDVFIKENPGLVDDKFIRDFISELNQCLFDIHSKNIIHRDIKPSNILLKSIEPLSIALIDFGISSISSSLIHQTNYNRTISYSSPEAISGVISPASDYWPMGIMALEMLLKKHPYEGMDAKSITYYITTKEVPGIESVTSDFYALIKGTLNRDDKKRWRYKEVCDWLSNIIKSDFYEPFSFYGSKCLDLKELSQNLIINWERAASEMPVIKQWLLKNVTDRGLMPLIKPLCQKGISGDDSLFELIYTVNPSAGMVYRKMKINREFLSDISYKIFCEEASEEERDFIDSLFAGGLFHKYYELADASDPFKSEFLALEEECRPLKDASARAEIVLKRLSPEHLIDKRGFFEIFISKIRKNKRYMSLIERIKKNEHYKIYIFLISAAMIFILASILIDIFD